MLSHRLFGGTRSLKRHRKYELKIEGVRGDYFANFKLLGQDHICDRVPRIPKEDWIEKLRRKNIYLEDEEPGESRIEMLIGADYYGSILEGQVEHCENGLTAIRTKLGWCLSGRTNDEETHSTLTMSVLTHEKEEMDITALWDLETIGIRDSTDTQNQRKSNAEMMKVFLETLRRDREGRYVVKLPWVSKGNTPSNNLEVAKERLRRMSKKLINSGRLKEYAKVFDEWMEEGLIECCEQKINDVHYLPHRAVFKPQSLTTPVRPVFDASCKMGRSPALNECLDKAKFARNTAHTDFEI